MPSDSFKTGGPRSPGPVDWGLGTNAVPALVYLFMLMMQLEWRLLSALVLRDLVLEMFFGG